MLLIAHKLAYLRVGDWQCSIEEDHQSLVVWWSAADARNGGDARDNGIILQSQVGDVEVSFGINERSLDLLDLHSIVVGTTLFSRKESVQKVGSADPIIIVAIEDGGTQTIRQSIDNKAIKLLVILVFHAARAALASLTAVALVIATSPLGVPGVLIGAGTTGLGSWPDRISDASVSFQAT